MEAEQWDAFGDALKEAGQLLQRREIRDDPLTRAEGYRYLTRLLRLSLEKNIEFSDPRFPQFYSLSHETAKIGNDNPDNFYMNCEISGEYDYRIRGQRGTIPYLSIESKAGSYGSSGTMEPTGHLELDELVMDEGGNFEILVSATPKPGNWLPLREDSDNLLVRQTFHDRVAESPASLSIECLNAAGSNVLLAENFQQQLAAAPQFINGTANLFADWMQLFSEHVNQLPPNDQSMCLRAGGDPSIYYHNSFWQLSEDEALVIELSPPQCKTWNFQLSNYWMESLDYRYHRIHVNKHNAVYSNDGSVQIVVAAQDPGKAYPNWLTTAGHALGGMLLRYVEAESQPPVEARVVKTQELNCANGQGGGR